MESKSKTPVGAYYERHHATGDRLRQAFLADVRGEMFASWIGSGKTLVDLGGRDGSLTRHYANGNRVIIADVDCAALAYAREHLKVETVEANLSEPLPFETDSVDAVVMAEVLEHLPYPRFSLGEIRRILRRGGVFVGSVPLAYHAIDRWRVLRGKKLLIADVDPTHLQFFKYEEARALLSDFFRLVEVRVLKGGKKARRYPKLFARDIAFHCIKE